MKNTTNLKTSLDVYKFIIYLLFNGEVVISLIFLLQIIVVVITGGLFGVNLYGTLMLRQYFDQVWFLPPDTMGYKYSITNSKVCIFVWYLNDFNLPHS